MKTNIDKTKSLAVLFPYLAEEWHPTKNGELTPYDVTKGSHKKVWWKCSMGHEWKTSVYSRGTLSTGCPVCDSEKRTSFPEQAIAFYLSKAYEVHNRMKVDGYELDIFIPKYKIGIEYDGAYYHSLTGSVERENRKNKKMKELGIYLIRIKEYKKTNEDLLAVDTYYGLQIKCNYKQNYLFINGLMNLILNRIAFLTNKKLNIFPNVIEDRPKILKQYLKFEKSNSLAVIKPFAAQKWDYIRNGTITPNKIPYSSKKHFFFKCKYCGNEWDSAVENVSNTKYCPRCIHLYESKNSKIKDRLKKVQLNYKNDFNYNLKLCFPELTKEWHPIKNELLNPEDYTPGSNQKIWWICSKCGYEWKTSIKSRTSGHGCTMCSIEKSRVTNGRKVINLDTKEIFVSMKEAARKNNIKSSSNIYYCCSGKNKTAGGYHWSYYTEL